MISILFMKYTNKFNNQFRIHFSSLTNNRKEKKTKSPLMMKNSTDHSYIHNITEIALGILQIME